MSAKQISDTDYKTLKAQYDALLDKNQNDLIKIKQKEKQLNDQLDKSRKEKIAIEEKYTQEVKLLQQQLEKQRKNHQQGELVVKVGNKEPDRVRELEIDVRRLMDQNIALTADNTTLKRTIEDFTHEIDKLKQFIASLQKQHTELKSTHSRSLSHSHTQSEAKIISEEDMNALKEQLNRIQKQLASMTAANGELKQKLKSAQEEARLLSDRERKSVHLLKKKDLQLSQVHEEVEKLRVATKPRKRKTESDQQCSKCRQHQQEIILLKQMVKSTKGMVRVREIEVEKYRMHSNEELLVKENRSQGKGEKGPTLPPLKKKNQ